MKGFFFLFFLLICSGISLAADSPLPPHMLGVSYGQGKGNEIHGHRLHYRWTPWHWHSAVFGLEISHARFQMYHQFHDKVNANAVAPVARFYLNVNEIPMYLEGSVGVSRISTKVLGGKRFGSKWNFQDILGVGVTLRQWDIRLQYLHYSNAKFAMPNPGIDLFPEIAVGFMF